MNIYSGNSRLWLANRFHLTIILPCRSYFCTAVFLEKKRTNERDEADSFTERERALSLFTRFQEFQWDLLINWQIFTDFQLSLASRRRKDRNRIIFLRLSSILLNLIEKSIPNKETFNQRKSKSKGEERNKLRNVKCVSTNCLTRR